MFPSLVYFFKQQSNSDIVYCYIEFKLRYLNNLNLFSIRVKDLFKPLWEKPTGFCSF